MKSLANIHDVAELRARVQTVRADSPRQWGRMTAHQMICHLTDAFWMGTERQPVSDLASLARRTVVKWVALYAPMRWPRGIRTAPELDHARGGGTAPAAFDADMQQLLATMDAAASDPRFFEARPHPIFGPISRAAWLRWGYLHVDHHLRQFGA